MPTPDECSAGAYHEALKAIRYAQRFLAVHGDVLQRADARGYNRLKVALHKARARLEADGGTGDLLAFAVGELGAVVRKCELEARS